MLCIVFLLHSAKFQILIQSDGSACVQATFFGQLLSMKSSVWLFKVLTRASLLNPAREIFMQHVWYFRDHIQVIWFLFGKRNVTLSEIEERDRIGSYITKSHPSRLTLQPCHCPGPCTTLCHQYGDLWCHQYGLRTLAPALAEGLVNIVFPCFFGK